MVEQAGLRISAVICTRNNGVMIAKTIQSLLENTCPSFEVLVIDQSSNTSTENSTRPFCADSRFRYIHSDSVGTGCSRTVGVEAARGEIVAFTDDDCTVPPDWLEKMAASFDIAPEIAVTYCQVTAAAHDKSKGFVPDYTIPTCVIWHDFHECTNRFGLGAGMAVRRCTVLSMGGFDGNLGPGSKFRTGEDIDIAIRAMAKGGWVYLNGATSVLHFGFRTWAQGREHSKRHFGIGAIYIKPLLCGYTQPAVWNYALRRILMMWAEPFQAMLRLQRPHGFKRIYYQILGIIQGIHTPVDRENILYL